jgi:hypothetical protein
MTWETILIAFAGGLFGSAIGALWAFALCGLLTMLGCILILAGGPDFLLLQVGLGPLFGPHCGGFLSGVIAASYASGIRKNHPGGSGRDILSPLVQTSWDVMAVGGLGGVAGVLLAWAIPQIPIIREFDALGLAIVIVTFAARLIFQKESPLGNASLRKQHGLLGTDNYAISWIGWMSPPLKLLAVGAGVGGVSGSVAKFSSDFFANEAFFPEGPPSGAGTVPVIFCWGLCAVMLAALLLGQGEIQKVPVVHCMAVLGAVGYLNTHMLAGAILCGIFAAYLQELLARLFTNRGSDHLDPPAAGIAFGIFILNILFKPEWIGLSGVFG